MSAGRLGTLTSVSTPVPVTVVLPTLNEQSYVRDCLDSLLSQDYEGEMEILVLDGGSSDHTRQIVEASGPSVRLLDNPGVTAASAMNLGLAQARHNLVVRADAHTLYASDYVRRSVEALAGSGADWVGGAMVPVGRNSFGRAVAAVTSSPVGVGPGRFHYATEEQDVETVYLGAFDRRIVADVGGYDAEHIQWAAEDQELNFRLRRAGRRIRLVPAIRSQYFPRDTPKALWRQYFNYGMCKASTLAKHRTLPYWRPLAPAILVAGLAGSLITGHLLPTVAYGVGSGVVTARLVHGAGAATHHRVLVVWICHVAYGLGFWAGVGRILRGVPFDVRPRPQRSRAVPGGRR